MLDHTLLARLKAAGLPIQRHQIDPHIGWFAGEGGDVGPYPTAEEALVAGIRWLTQRSEEYRAARDEAEAEVDRLTRELADRPSFPGDGDEPPGPFRQLLG